MYPMIVAVSAQSSGSLTGTIILNGSPAAGAVVEISPVSEPLRKTSTTTDSEGRYRFDGLAPGEYRIWAEKREPSPRPGLSGAALGGAFGSAIIKGGKTRRVDLTLTTAVYVSTNVVREYVNIAADETQPAEQVSKTVSEIGAQEMRDRADFSLVESLRSIPGFRVQQLGGFGRTASVKSRGLRNQDTAVLIDGIRFRDASAISGDATSFLGDFTLTNVSKIEVLRGAGSSLYGTNAIGGTIDFQTPEPRQGWHGNISGALGGLGLARFRAGVSNSFLDDRLGFNIGGSRTVYSKGIDGDDDAENSSFQTRVEAKPFPKASISGRLFISDAKAKLNNSPDTFGTLPDQAAIIDARSGINFIPDADDPDSLQRSKFFSGQIVLTQTIAEGLVAQAYYSGVTTSRRNTNGPLGTGFQPFGGDETYRFDGRIDTFSGKINWSSGSNMLTAGYEHEREKLQNRGVFVSPTDNFATTARQRSNTLFVRDLVGLFEGALNLSGGFRAQWFKLATPEFSSSNYPNRFDAVTNPPTSMTFDGSSAYYFSKSNTTIRSHVGSGYRVPSLYERFGSYFFLGAFFGIGNPDLKPEKSFSADAGIDQELAGRRLKLTANYFYNEIRDEVTYLPTDDLGGPSYFNADRHFSRGAEFVARAKPFRDTNLSVSYTFVNSDTRTSRRLTFIPPATIVSNDRRTFGVPSHQLTIVVTQRFKDFWVNFDFLATSGYLAPIFSNSTFSTYTYRFAGNRRGDVTAGYTFRQVKQRFSLRLFGTIENMFDNEYYENGFRTAGANARIGLSLGF